jgi:hypothetical protein
MKILSEQKSKAVAEKNGWSLEFAEGFLKGEYSRRTGTGLSSYTMVGFDEYCLGFRTGYFERRNPAATRDQIPAAPDRTVQKVRGGAVAASTTATTFKQGFAY